VTITDDMGIQATLARIREITAPVAPAAAPASAAPASSTATAAFARELAQARTPAAATPTGMPATSATLTPNGMPTTPGPAAGGLPGLTVQAALTFPAGAALPQGVAGIPVMLVPMAPGMPPPGATGAVPVGPGGAGPGTAGPRGQLIARIAAAELGVREQPPGSNDAPRIATYRTATAGAGVGPWCAYFTSWVAAQAGVPVGPDGRGEGWVPSVERWGKDTGRWIPSGAPTPPQAGDLVVFDRNRDGLTDHIGVVTGVRPDGGIETVEGNASDAVSRRSYDPGGWTGVVRLVPPGQ
jgi:hypothetical protein